MPPPAPSSLAAFVRQLAESGRVRVPLLASADELADSALEADEVAELHQALRELDAAARAELAFEPPAFQLAAARWAAFVLYRACQLVVSRRIEVGALATDLLEPGELPEADVIYSVDLLLQYLPDVVTIAERESRADPLLRSLERLAVDWPLSAVGLERVPPRAATSSFGASLRPILANRCLRQLYVDRLLDRNDRARMSAAPEAIQEALRAATGEGS